MKLSGSESQATNQSPSPAGARLNLASEMPAWRRYLAAFVCILAAFAIRYWLTPILGEELPFMLFIAASLVAAWYGGAGAGIAALLLGLFVADYFFLAKAKAGLTRSTEILYLVRYVFTASLGIGLIETLHRNRRRLQREIARRQTSEAELLQAQAQLEAHAGELEHCVQTRTAELAATVKYLESLLYHIGHNLRAPLRAMEGYASILVEEHAAKLDPAARDYSEHISDAAKRMDELIHDLLDYGRLGYIQLELSEVDLGVIVKRVLFRLGFEIRTRDARINVIGDLPQVFAHAEVLEQVLTNLVENAIKFTAPGIRPTVHIQAEIRTSTIRLWIEDNGVGVPQAFSERIFEPFETLSSGQSASGTGIGLAIAKQGIQRMGGKIGFQSNPLGGSRFWIELPKASVSQNVPARLISSRNESATMARSPNN